MKDLVIDYNVVPFVKWAGGKRQLISQIRERMPGSYDRYYEPFVGGGGVLFGLQPEYAIVGDLNRALINTYRQIRNYSDDFIDAVAELDRGLFGDAKSWYYSCRQRYNDKLSACVYDVEMAALFVFLNKHCFNGLYRVNKDGLFNVPYNGRVYDSIDVESVRAVSRYLSVVMILCCDFEELLENASEGDFVFFDSLYVPIKPTSFESYTKEGFSLEDHKRLAALYDELTGRGCYCMLTNHNTDLIYELYGNKGYRIDVVSAKRMINSDASKRSCEEVIICNY